MAINVQQIDPLDLTPFVGVGVDLPFSGTSVFNTTYQTKDAIKANLINYFLTNKGERYLNVNFGSDIRLLLFDNITQEKLERIKNTVEEEIKTYFPRVRQVEFQINSSPDTNLVTVHYRYRIVNTNIEDEVVINIEQ